jgi:hypothetical protein
VARRCSPIATQKAIRLRVSASSGSRQEVPICALMFVALAAVHRGLVPRVLRDAERRLRAAR